MRILGNKSITENRIIKSGIVEEIEKAYEFKLIEEKSFIRFNPEIMYDWRTLNMLYGLKDYKTIPQSVNSFRLSQLCDEEGGVWIDNAEDKVKRDVNSKIMGQIVRQLQLRQIKVHSSWLIKEDKRESLLAVKTVSELFGCIKKGLIEEKTLNLLLDSTAIIVPILMDMTENLYEKLKEIIPVWEFRKLVGLSLYGKAKVGKTILWVPFPAPIYMLIANASGVYKEVELNRLKEIFNIYKAINKVLGNKFFSKILKDPDMKLLPKENKDIFYEKVNSLMVLK